MFAVGLRVETAQTSEELRQGREFFNQADDGVRVEAVARTTRQLAGMIEPRGLAGGLRVTTVETARRTRPTAAVRGWHCSEGSVLI